MRENVSHVDSCQLREVRSQLTDCWCTAGHTVVRLKIIKDWKRCNMRWARGTGKVIDAGKWWRPAMVSWAKCGISWLLVRRGSRGCATDSAEIAADAQRSHYTLFWSWSYCVCITINKTNTTIDKYLLNCLTMFVNRWKP